MSSFNDPKLRTTLSGKPPEPGHEDRGAPGPIDSSTGMHTDYWVLPEEERKKGFVRPFRNKYVHVGLRPQHPTRPLTPVELERYAKFDYIIYEKYPEGSTIAGMFWTEKTLNSGCNTLTKMGDALSETYARDPSYYGSTFCVGCRAHFPVAEFVWSGTNERVGS